MIAAAIVMLLLMIGALVWKFAGSKEKAATAPPPPPTIAAPILEAPPPPPPAVEDTAPKQAVQKGGAKGGGGGLYGCDKECTGSATGDLKAALAAKAGQARGCYERALRQNAFLQGRLVAAVRISPKGAVCSASVAQTTLGDPGVVTCVLQMLRSSAYPSPVGGCVDTAVPMNFIPKK